MNKLKIIWVLFIMSVSIQECVFWTQPF